jgi:hypothetical protein
VLTFNLVFHPGLKLEYFRQKGWEEEWIDTAEELIHTVYAAQYEEKEDVVGANPDMPAAAVS